MAKVMGLLAVGSLLALAGCGGAQTGISAANLLTGANTACVAANADLAVVNLVPAAQHLVKNNGNAITAEQSVCAALQTIDAAVAQTAVVAPPPTP